MDQLEQLKRDVENCRNTEKKRRLEIDNKEQGMWDSFEKSPDRSFNPGEFT
jgi:hypothetical protein